MLEIKNLSKKIGAQTIFKDINFSINKGELAVLLGRNGKGKTTLLKCVSGLSSYNRGQISSLGKKIGISLNDKDLLIPKLTVYEYLKFVCALNDLNENDLDKKINDLLTYFSIDDDKNKYIYKLSKGGISKVSLIGALIIDSEIIILDEPFSGMDIITKKDTIHLLNEKRKKGAIILISTHNLELLYDICTSVFILKNESLIVTSPELSIENIEEILKDK